jgi:hypothetical protein
MSVTAKAEQSNEHDDKQEHVRNKRDDHCHFGGLDVERLTGGTGSFTCVAELSEGLARKV